MTALKSFLSSAGSIATAYEIDFAAQATQDLKTGGDGSKTIDGKTWTLYNEAGSSVFDLNGSGLRMTLSGGSNQHNSNTRDFPRIGISLYQLGIAPSGSSVPAIPMQDMRVWWMMDSTTFNNVNYEQGFCGVMREPHVANSSMFIANYFSQTKVWGLRLATDQGAGSDSVEGVVLDTFPSSDVVMLRIRGSLVDAYVGTSVAGNFPDFSALKHYSGGALLQDANLIGGFQFSSDSTMIMAGLTGNTLGSTNSIVWRRLKVETAV